MKRTRHPCGARLITIGLLILSLAGTLPTLAHAAGTTISIFYPATKAAYDAWNATTSTARPPKTIAFPTKTSTVTFYFEYSGATPNKTQYKIVIHDHSGATYLTHGPYVFTRGAALHMSPMKAPGGGAYPDGSYRADLLVDGHMTLSATFSVGAAPVTNVRIPRFYTTTRAAYDAWPKNHYAPPPSTTTFPHGVSTLAFYYRYQGARPNQTRITIIIHSHSGATFATAGPFVLPGASSSQMAYKSAPGGAYPDGSYRADFETGGQVIAHTSFTVGNTARVTITSFYPATKAERDRWANSSSMAPPKQTTFFAHGTSIVAFYYDYKGAQAKVTTFTITIHARSGATFATYNDTFQDTSAPAMRYISAPNGAYPDGVYRADVETQGHVAASTTFTVTAPVKTPLFYTGTKAAKDTWHKNNLPPPRTSVFPHSTPMVAFYFQYQNAITNVTQFQFVVHTQSGATLATSGGGPYPLIYAYGSAMYLVSPASGVYPDGRYSADLIVDGHTAGSTAFTVAPQGVSASAFYPATMQAYTSWSGAAPPQSMSFPAGTARVAFYFNYTGGTANKTVFKVLVRDHTGGVFATFGPSTLAAAADGHMAAVEAPYVMAFPNGAYRADLIMDGRIAGNTIFTVGQSRIAQAGTPTHILAARAAPGVSFLFAAPPWRARAGGRAFTRHAGKM